MPDEQNLTVALQGAGAEQTSCVCIQSGWELLRTQPTLVDTHTHTPGRTGRAAGGSAMENHDQHGGRGCLCGCKFQADVHGRGRETLVLQLPSSQTDLSGFQNRDGKHGLGYKVILNLGLPLAASSRTCLCPMKGDSLGPRPQGQTWGSGRYPVCLKADRMGSGSFGFLVHMQQAVPLGRSRRQEAGAVPP